MSFPITMRNYDIMGVTKYESSGAASTARSMVTRHRRSSDMSTIRIPLNSRKYPGLHALIDEADFELVSEDSWWPDSSHGTNFYARSSKGGRSMHRVIMGVSLDQRVDHINQNGLDNRRSNLRIATTAQNNANVRPTRMGESGYLGAYQVASGRWASQYRRNNRTVCLGTFDTSEEAAAAYDAAITESRGEFAVTNESLGLLKERQS